MTSHAGIDPIEPGDSEAALGVPKGQALRFEISRVEVRADSYGDPHWFEWELRPGPAEALVDVRTIEYRRPAIPPIAPQIRERSGPDALDPRAGLSLVAEGKGRFGVVALVSYRDGRVEQYPMRIELEDAYRSSHPVTSITSLLEHVPILRNVPEQERHDVIQRALLRMFKALVGGGEIRTPQGYFATVVKNELLAERRASKRLLYNEELLAMQVDQRTPTQQDAAELAEVRQSLQAAVQKLHFVEREAIRLRFSEGMSLGEIAKAMGISRAKVHRCLTRTIKELRRNLTRR